MPEIKDPFDYPVNILAEPEFDEFDALCDAPEDPLFGLKKKIAEIMANDPDAEVVDTTLGVYRNEYGKPHTFTSVVEAKRRLGHRTAMDTNPEYLGQAGDREFINQALKVIFGSNHPILKEPHRERIAVLGSMGGTGGLFVAAELLKMLEEDSGKKVVIAHGTPTWPNHKKIFEQKHGFEMVGFEHTDENGQPSALNLEEAVEALKRQEKRHSTIPVVLLHGVCHNPTGLDYNEAQIEDTVTGLRAEKVHVIIDMAYHGLGDGFERDGFLIRRLAESGVPIIVTYSFSKNQSAYRDRTGLVISVNQNPKIAQRVQKRMEVDAVRPAWSNPAAHGQLVTREILTNPELTELWLNDVEGARREINARRQRIAKLTGDRFPTVGRGRGLFGILGLTREQVNKLLEPHFDEESGKNVYVVMPKSSRINVGGVGDIQIPSLCDRLNHVYGQKD